VSRILQWNGQAGRSPGWLRMPFTTAEIEWSGRRWSRLRPFKRPTRATRLPKRFSYSFTSLWSRLFSTDPTLIVPIPAAATGEVPIVNVTVVPAATVCAVAVPAAGLEDELMVKVDGLNEVEGLNAMAQVRFVPATVKVTACPAGIASAFESRFQMAPEPAVEPVAAYRAS